LGSDDVQAEFLFRTQLGLADVEEGDAFAGQIDVIGVGIAVELVGRDRIGTPLRHFGSFLRGGSFGSGFFRSFVCCSQVIGQFGVVGLYSSQSQVAVGYDSLVSHYIFDGVGRSLFEAAAVETVRKTDRGTVGCGYFLCSRIQD